MTFAKVNHENARRRIQNHDTHEARKAKREISDAHTQHREIHISSGGKTWNSWIYPEKCIDSRFLSLLKKGFYADVAKTKTGETWNFVKMTL